MNSVTPLIMTLLLPWVPSCSREEQMSSRHPGDRHDIHNRWDPSGQSDDLWPRQGRWSAWLTSMCGRPSVLWSLQRRQVRGTATHDSDYLQTAMLKVQHCQNASWSSSSHCTPYSQTRGCSPWLQPPFASFFSHSFKALPDQNTELLGPGTQVCTFRVSSSLAFLMLRLKSRHSSLKKKCYLATGCPPPPEKMSQLNFLPAEPKIKAHAQ